MSAGAIPSLTLAPSATATGGAANSGANLTTGSFGVSPQPMFPPAAIIATVLVLGYVLMNNGKR